MGWGSREWEEPHLAHQEVDPPKQDQDVAQQEHGVSSSHFRWEEGLRKRHSGRTQGLESSRETLRRGPDLSTRCGEAMQSNAKEHGLRGRTPGF